MRAVRPAPSGYIHSVVALDQTPAGSATQKHRFPKSMWPPLPPLALVALQSNQRSQRWEMVSQLLSAAAEAELRHLRDERRGQSPSSPLRASAPAILRTSASGKASCSSGSAPICCCVSEHRGPAAITAARSQTGVLCCFLRAAASFDMPISRSCLRTCMAPEHADSARRRQSTPTFPSSPNGMTSAWRIGPATGVRRVRAAAARCLSCAWR